MATIYLALLNGQATGNILAATQWNKLTEGMDRQGLMAWELDGSARKAGWCLTSGATTLTSGSGQVGPCWCVTVTSQAISGLTAAATNYVFAKTDAGSAASGTVDFVARATSTAIANLDGYTAALLLGKAYYAATTGLKTLSSALVTNLPAYMRPVTVGLYPTDAIDPATSAATASQYGSVFNTAIIKFPALSTTTIGWDYHVPADYRGTIVLHTEWIASGLAGVTRLGWYSRHRNEGEQWDVALVSCLATKSITISGTNGYVRRFSHLWGIAAPAANERGTIAIRRVGTAASDTMNGAARLLSARAVFYTAR